MKNIFNRIYDDNYMFRFPQPVQPTNIQRDRIDENSFSSRSSYLSHLYPDQQSYHSRSSTTSSNICNSYDECGNQNLQRYHRYQHSEEQIRVISSAKTTRNHHHNIQTTNSQTMTLTETCRSLPSIRKHVTVISFPTKLDRSHLTNSMGSTEHLSTLTTSMSKQPSYISAPNYIQSQNYNLSPHYTIATDRVMLMDGGNHHHIASGGSSNSNGSGYMNITGSGVSGGKKTAIRNGDVLKRCRIQPAYELSQDILDKQIEVLERKYGGVKARNAALTIQRAFRRYTLLKKFTAITAMAKAEKRISRRIPAAIASDPDEADNRCHNRKLDGMAVTTLPLRSMSLRERRSNNTNNNNTSIGTATNSNTTKLDNNNTTLTVSLPRSQSGTPTICWDATNSCLGGGGPQHYYSSAAVDNSGAHSPNELLLTAEQQLYHIGGMTPNSGYHNLADASRTATIYRRVPPEVPKRTSSISSRSSEPRPYHHYHKSNGSLSRSNDNGSLSSVQSSGSDSSISVERIQCDFNISSPPLWKPHHHHHHSAATVVNLNATLNSANSATTHEYAEPTTTILDNITTKSNVTVSSLNTSDNAVVKNQQQSQTVSNSKLSETVRKRHYRVGLNLFNKKPEKGIANLIRRGFVDSSPQGVARFLISRKGLSKQIIGEYLGNIQNPFCMAVLECFVDELDLSGMQVDVALRKFQQHFRMPGEAQKIERLMEIFAQRYCQCNADIVAKLRSPDTIFVLAFAIIMLNTDLHTPNIKPEKRMKLEDFIRNLRGTDDCGDIDSDMLTGIYERVKVNEFKPGSDHVTQVMKVQTTIVGKKPNMALPHRRLVCYCRLYEIADIYKKERPGVHQREVFLFNDLLVITKMLSKKKSTVTYTFRDSYPLCGMVVTLFEVAYYPYGIRLSQRVDGRVLVTFNARNEHDRCKFGEDLKEAISEMDEMENLRIEAELERQKSNRCTRTGPENRDSGVADVEVCSCHCNCTHSNNQFLHHPLMNNENHCVNNHNNKNGNNHDELMMVSSHEQSTQQVIKRSALSNSLLDIHEQFTTEKSQRRGSVGSLDSGMSVSFQANNAGGATNNYCGTMPEKYSHTSNNNANKSKRSLHHVNVNVPNNSTVNNNNNPSFLGGIFRKGSNASKSTEV